MKSNRLPSCYTKLLAHEQQAILQASQIGSHPQSIHGLGRQARGILLQLSKQIRALMGVPGKGYQLLWYNSPGEAIWQLLWGMMVASPGGQPWALSPLGGALHHPIWQQVTDDLQQCQAHAQQGHHVQPSAHGQHKAHLWALCAHGGEAYFPKLEANSDWLLIDGLEMDKPCSNWPASFAGRSLFVGQHWQHRGVVGLTWLALPDHLPLVPVLGQGNLLEESIQMGTPPLAWLGGQLALLMHRDKTL